MSNDFKIEGLLGRDIEVRHTPSGVAAASSSVADTPRRFNRDTNQHEDAGPTLWMNFTVWGDQGERLAQIASKGDKVTLYGSLKSEEWQDKTSGEKRSRTTMRVDAYRVHEKRNGGGGQASGQFQQGGFQQAAPTGQFGGQQQGGFQGDDSPPF